MPVRSPIDFDGPANALIENAYRQADNDQSVRDEQYQRDWLLYNAYIDASERNPDMPNISLPKMYSIIETKTPEFINAIAGRRPILPFEARRKEFQKAADIQTFYLDDLLDKARIYTHLGLLSKLKILYGTAFINVLPYYEPIIEKAMVPDSVGGFRIQETPSHRLRLRIEVRAPWEVRVDPYATSLNEKEDCRYLIKIDIRSRRQIKELYAKGAYPGLDIEKLDAYNGSRTNYRGQHWGQQMLRAYGLPTPMNDDDVGLLFRYESPDRYIDSWMNEVTLRDGDNPFSKEKGGHGLINTSRMIHVMPPHTQSQFWGIGEAKPNEILIAMMNDIQNLTFASHGMLNQPPTFFREGAIERDDIIYALGHRIPVKSNSERPLSDDYAIPERQGLPADHYLIPQMLERWSDLTSGLFGPGRGESLRQRGDVKATEVVVAEKNAQIRQQETVRLGEDVCLADLGKKASAITDQFKNFDDLVESVGIQDAIQVITANPADLPGGYNMPFKGSARVQQLDSQRQNLVTLAPIVQAFPFRVPGGLETKLLDLYDFEQNDIDEILGTKEQIAQSMQFQFALAQQERQDQIENKSAGSAAAK